MTTSSWKEQFARLGPIRVVDRVPSGSPVVIALRPGPDPAGLKAVTACLALCRRGLSMLRAKRLVEEMLDTGRAVALLPIVEDTGALARELAESGIEASHLAVPEVDPKGVRDRLGLTQEQFSLRFGLDLASIQNWETGRRTPDTAVRSYLRVIDRFPDEASQALEVTLPAR